MLQEAGHIKNIYYIYSCFDFPAHSMFTFHESRGSMGTSIFGKSSSTANNTRSRLLSRDCLFVSYDYDKMQFIWLYFRILHFKLTNLYSLTNKSLLLPL